MSTIESALSVAHAEADDVFTKLQRVIRGRMPELDGLRGIAILTVLWHNGVWAGHWSSTGTLTRLLNLSAGIGWVGVQLFFVLSGFLITGILLDEKGAPHQFRNFYVRRILRIFPLYYGTLFLLLVLLPALNVRAAIDMKNGTQQIWYWLFLSNWSIPIIGGPGALSHFWSLAVEEQFYLLWPFAVVGLSHKGLAKLCLGLVISALIMRVAMINYDLNFATWRAYEFTFARWDALAIGALLALTVRLREWQAWLQRFALPVAATALIYIAGFIAIEHNYAPVEHGVAALNQTIAALLFAALLYLGIRPLTTWSKGWCRFLNNRALRNVGKYSYAMYVFHYPLLMFFNIYLSESTKAFEAAHPLIWTPLRVAMVGIVSYGLAVGSWYLLEQPCLRLKRYFVSRPEHDAATSLS